MKLFLLITLSALFIGCNAIPHASTSQEIEAPNRAFPIVSQKGISGNACGPASIVNALGSGSEPWNAALSPYSSSRSAVLSIMRTYGGRPSVSFKKRNRWNKLMGMNLEDLTLTAQEITRATDPTLPSISSHITISSGSSSPLIRVKAVRQKMALSLKKGLPPIANIARVAHRPSPRNKVTVWDTVGSHSVVIRHISPIHEEMGLPYFFITYADPANGRELRGKLGVNSGDTIIPQNTLVVSAPSSDIFKSILSPETPNYLSLTSLIGAF